MRTLPGSRMWYSVPRSSYPGVYHALPTTVLRCKKKKKPNQNRCRSYNFCCLKRMNTSPLLPTPMEGECLVGRVISIHDGRPGPGKTKTKKQKNQKQNTTGFICEKAVWDSGTQNKVRTRHESRPPGCGKPSKSSTLCITQNCGRIRPSNASWVTWRSWYRIGVTGAGF